MATWFRMYAGYRNNRKTHSLSLEVRCAHMDLMCMACELDKAGFVFTAQDSISCMAWELRITPERAGEILQELVKFQLLDLQDGNYVVHDYAQMQYLSDTSADRMRKHRAGKDNGDEKPDITEAVTCDSPSPSHVTPVDCHTQRHRDALEQNRADTEQSRTDNTLPSPSTADPYTHCLIFVRIQELFAIIAEQQF